MRFLIDAQLPPLLCDWLAMHGHRAEHVADLGMAGETDWAIWARATADGAVLLTKDADFVAIRQRVDVGPAVCWLRIGNAANPEFLTWIESVFPVVLAAIEAGETIIEVR